MKAFLGFRQGMRNPGVCLKCCHSSAVGASCFYHSVLLLMLQASKIMQEKKKKEGCAVVWGSLAPVV